MMSREVRQFSKVFKLQVVHKDLKQLVGWNSRMMPMLQGCNASQELLVTNIIVDSSQYRSEARALMLSDKLHRCHG
jgi:ABC-type uncharacterized transport system permease subunit